MSTATLSPRRSNRAARNGKANIVASAVENVLDKAAAPTAPTAPPVLDKAAADKADADAKAAAHALAMATQRQSLADGGRAATVALACPVTRKALLAAVSTVKRSDLSTDAAHNVPRALERLTKAHLKALAKRIDSLADFIALADGATDANLRGANVSTRAGSVSVAALINALADANSKADALSMFAAV